MSQVNVFEIKAKFAEYLDRAARGERVVIYRYNKPVAELRPVHTTRTDARPVGPIEGRPTFDISPAFFEPLADDELLSWEGRSAIDPAYPSHVPDTSARVAESAEPAAPPRTRKRRL